MSDGYDEGDLACTLTVNTSNERLELYLAFIASHLRAEELNTSVEVRRSTCRDAETYIVLNGNLFRRPSKGGLLVPRMSRRYEIVIEYHDSIAHWDVKSTRRLITERFQWPGM